jgi:sarcosine oxidase subunit gamma
MIQELSALSGQRLPDAGDRLKLAVAQDCARFSLRVRPQALARAGKAFGCAMPGQIGGLASSGDRLALCLGPDEWFLIAPTAAADAVRDRFATVMEGSFSLVEVSHREVGVEVRGTAATLALSSVCALDLHSMPSGSATRTILDKVPAVLIKHGPDHYRIEVWQSFASHLWTMLAAVSREIALDI